MVEIERDGDDVLIRMKTKDLEDLTNVLESAGNSAARYHNSFPEGSIVKEMHLNRAHAAWNWSNYLGTCPPNGSNAFNNTI